MKKIYELTLLILIICCLAGCSGKKDPAPAAADREISAATEDPGGTGKTAPEITTGDEQLLSDPAEQVDSPVTGITTSEVTSEPHPQSGETTAAESGEAADTSAGKETDRRQLSGEEAGQVIYLQGDVEIARDGIFLDDVDYGTGVENFDVIRTGGLSATDIELSQEEFPGTVISLSENTAFALEMNKIENTSKTSIEILTGALSLKVDSLMKDQDLEVSSDVAVVGVRGTVFSVASIPSGDLLVTCKEGRVLCTDDKGGQMEAVPGRAVEKLAGADLGLVDITGRDVDKYLGDWLEDKIRLLKNDALKQIKKNVLEYDKYLQTFTAHYEQLTQKNEILDRWKAEDIKGKIQSLAAQIMQDKKQIIGYLFDIRQSLVGLNRSYHRLLQLKEYHDQGFGVGKISDTRTTTQFFTNLEKGTVMNMIAEVQYIQKLFDKRNAGISLLEEFGNLDLNMDIDLDLDVDDFFNNDDSDFFGNDDDFF